jgi:hypothetical protein
MKKLQNYLMKPEELRKKLENPRFRQDFIDWSKNNISVNRDNSSKNSRSRSPVDHIQHSIQLHQKKQASSNKENLRTQSALRQQPTTTRPAPRTSLTKMGHAESAANRSSTAIKRNVSNATLGRGGSEARGQHSLNNKARYSSCASIEHPRKERSVTHLTLVEEKKIKQRYSYRTRQGVQITNPNKVNQDSLVIKTKLGDRDINLYAVADGHGAFGHLVSQYLVKNITKSI